MPVATRAVALQEAAKIVKSGAEILALAEQFHAFIMKDEQIVTGPQLAAAVAPALAQNLAEPAKKRGPGRPPKVSEEEVVAQAIATATAKAEAEADADIPQSEVVAVVEALLDAGKKDEAVSLFQIHGAKSLSSLAKADYGKFIAAAKQLLAAPATGLLD